MMKILPVLKLFPRTQFRKRARENPCNFGQMIARVARVSIARVARVLGSPIARVWQEPKLRPAPKFSHARFRGLASTVRRTQEAAPRTKPSVHWLQCHLPLVEPKRRQ